VRRYSWPSGATAEQIVECRAKGHDWDKNERERSSHPWSATCQRCGVVVFDDGVPDGLRDGVYARQRPRAGGDMVIGLIGQQGIVCCVRKAASVRPRPKFMHYPGTYQLWWRGLYFQVGRGH
jgi:hypothetical protein